MPLDASIYAQQRPFRLDDPMKGVGEMVQLRQAQKQFRLDDDLSAAGQESGGDPEKMAQLLMSRGQYEPALKLKKQADDKKKADVEQRLKLAEAAGSDSIALDTLWRQALQQSGGNREAALQRVQPIYQQVNAKWAQMGFAGPDTFDPDANFANIGQAKEISAHLKSLAPDIVMTDTGGAMTPVNRNPLAGPVGPYAGGQSIPKTAAPAQPPSAVKEYEYARGQGYQGTFEQFQLDQRKAGATNLTVNGPMTPGKTAAGKVDEEMLDTTKGLMRLDTIASQFKPEYQTILTRGNQWWSSVKEKAGVDLKVKEKKDLEEFSSYKRNAINSLNEYIKMITGAAMSEPEAQRILRGMPSPGQGIFDGDSPTEFKAKLDDAMKQTKMAVARLAYIKRKGMSLEDGLGKGLTLEGMPSLINERGVELEKELKRAQPGADEKALKRAVRRQLGVEFGLSSD